MRRQREFHIGTRNSFMFTDFSPLRQAPVGLWLAAGLVGLGVERQRQRKKTPVLPLYSHSGDRLAALRWES
jgi:hypothetical protein